MRLRARRLQWRRRAAYPVGVRGVGAGEDVQQVVAISGNGGGSLVVQSAVGAAAGSVGTLQQQQQRDGDAQVRVPARLECVPLAARCPTCAALGCCAG